MSISRLPFVALCLVWLCVGVQPATAQNDRREYPRLLKGAIAEVNVGHISYPFSQRQLEPGHVSESVEVPNLGVRVSIGRRINDRLSAHLLYLRPTHWVRYRNINGDTSSRSVWTNIMGATLLTRRSINDAVSVYGEAGLAIVTRNGFDVDQRPAVDDTVYLTPLLGGGVEYAWNPRWGLKTGVTFAAGRASASHPRTIFVSSGITYQVTPDAGVPRQQTERQEHVFPEHLFQVGYTTSALGYGFNRSMAPIFWQGDAEVSRGLTLHYQRNVFHTEKLFSIDLGASFSYGRSRQEGQNFVAVSVYPLFRWTFLRREAADLYFSYSLAGPTLISQYILDGQDTGKHFTFQDLLGVGFYAGRDRRVNVEIRIGHYSNANLIPNNAGIRVPLTLNIGYAM
jgi:hypothetical protein